MSDDHGITHDDEQRERQTAHEEAGSSADFALGLAPGSAHELPPSALGNPALQRSVNSPVRVATIQRLQQQYGNRATQRFLQRQTGFATMVQREEAPEVEEDELKKPLQTMRAGRAPLSVQRDDPPGGNVPAPPAPAAPTPATGGGGNPAMAAAWNASVVRPIGEAANQLQGRVGKSKAQSAVEKIESSRQSISDIRATYAGNPANEGVHGRLGTAGNAIVAMKRSLEPHAGTVRPVDEIHLDLEGIKPKLETLGTEIASTNPAAAPSAPSSGGATAPSTTPDPPPPPGTP